MEVYDALINCKELSWFCSGCSEEISKCTVKKEDKVIGLLEKVLDRLCGLEDRLGQKVDVRAFEELEERVRCLEENVKDRGDELKGRILDNEEKVAQAEVKFGSGSSVVVRCEEEDSDIENRRNNVIMYKVKEIQSEVAEDRKAGDMLFVYELCNDVLKVEVGIVVISKRCSGWGEESKERRGHYWSDSRELKRGMR